MNQKSKFDELDQKIEKLIQLNKFSSIQTALLAILFSLLIFSVTIILYYREQNVLVWIIAHLILAYDVMMLYWLLLSIFSGDEEATFRNFQMILFYLIFSGSIVLVILLFIAITFILNFTIPVNNVVAVVILLAVFLIALFIDKKLDLERNYLKRFNLLFEESKKITTLEKEDSIAKLKKKYGKYFATSVTVGVIATFISGLWEVISQRTINENHYGFPLVWIIERIDTTPRLEINHYHFLGNWFIYTAIIFVLLLAYPYFARFVDKKTNLKHLKKKESEQKDKIQNAENWENNLAFVRYE